MSFYQSAKWLLMLFIAILPAFQVTHSYEFKCPSEWREFGHNCYQFIRSPVKTFEEASLTCGKFNAHLLSVLSGEEHNFVTDYLRQNDPVHQSWYTSALDTGSNSWRWNVPIHVLATTGSTSSIASGGSDGRNPLGPIDSNTYPNGGRVGNREYFSILATLWLPVDNSALLKKQKEQDLSPLHDPNRPVQQTIDVWSNQNAKNAVYK